MVQPEPYNQPTVIDFGKRKVQATGGAYSVSIPRTAAKHMRLERGSSVRWVLIGNTLHLTNTEDDTCKSSPPQ